MFFSKFRICIMLTLVSLSIFSVSTFAAGTIPRDGLRLELLMATGSQDTSGNGRIVSSTGITPTYQIDPLYGVPFAQFTGSGGLKVNTAWSASIYDDFTISFWSKPNLVALNNNSIWNVVVNNTGNIIQWSMYLMKDSSYIMYDTPMVLFSSKISWSDFSNMRFAFTKEWKCSFSSRSAFDMLYNIAWPIWVKNAGFITDVFSNLDYSYNCASLVDGKWHNVVLMRKSWILSFYIDGNVIASFSYNNGSIQKLLSIWNMGTTMNSTTYQYYSESVKNSIWNSHFYKGWIASYRLYSRYLSSDEIEALGDEYRYAQSDLAGAGNIQVSMDKYSKPMLYANFRNILNSLNKDNVTYEYSVNSGSFTPIADITQISSGSWTIDYHIWIDLSWISDGRTSVIFRVRWSDQSFQNIGTIVFTKLDTQVGIIINQPNTGLNPDKSITAYVTGGTGQLFMFLTRWTVCDASITTWENYSDLTFASKNENGTQVCYKAIFPSINKTIYKLSSPIQGIQLKDQINVGYGVFSNYLLWNKSLYQKSDDTASMMLELLGVSSAQSQGTINGVTMTDINGDGLVDFLYSRNDTIRRAIIINNGNYTFKTVYKCAYDAWNPISYSSTWFITPAMSPYFYGDCADITR